MDGEHSDIWFLGRVFRMCLISNIGFCNIGCMPQIIQQCDVL